MSDPRIEMIKKMLSDLKKSDRLCRSKTRRIREADDLSEIEKGALLDDLAVQVQINKDRKLQIIFGAKQA